MGSSTSARSHFLLVASALALAIIFTTTVITYYRAYHMGVGAASAALVLGLPVAFALALASGYLTWLVGRRVSGGERPRLVWIVSVMVLSLAVLFVSEWVRTTDSRVRDALASTVQPPNWRCS